ETFRLKIRGVHLPRNRSFFLYKRVLTNETPRHVRFKMFQPRRAFHSNFLRVLESFSGTSPAVFGVLIEKWKRMRPALGSATKPGTTAGRAPDAKAEAESRLPGQLVLTNLFSNSP